jgi:uncharacterized protein involved in exopolysaccharide biosynthesis
MSSRSATRHTPAGADNELGFRLTLTQVVEFLPRYAGTIAAVFVFTVLSAYVGLSLTTELYEARSTLLVKLGRENLDAPPTANNSVLSTGVRREELGSEAQLLRSTDLIAQVVDSIGPAAFEPQRVVPQSLVAKAKSFAKAGLRWIKAQYLNALVALDLKKRLDTREQAIALLQDELVIEPQKDTDVIGLRLRLADPALAVRVQQTLIDRYLARRIAIRHDTGARDFLERQTADLREALVAAEAVRNNWKRRRDLTVPAEQKSLLLRRIQDLSAQQTKLRADREALQQETSAARNLLASRAETVTTASMATPNPAFELFDDRLTKLEADRAHVLATYMADASTVRVLDEEITSLRALRAARDRTQIGSETSQPNPLRQQLEQRLQDNEIRDQGLAATDEAETRQLAELRSQLAAIEQGDARLADLERDRQVAELAFLSAVKRRDEANVAARLDLNRISNVSVAAAPTATVEPVYPRKLLMMIVALALGLAAGLGVAITLEWTSDTIRNAEEIESLTDLVCLGSLSLDNRREKAIAWR